MKFRLSTLLWCMVIACVVMGSYVFVRQERAINQELMAENQATLDEANAAGEEMKELAFEAFARSGYYERSLGLFDRIHDETKPQVLFIRMPRELGGMQLHGLPFTWQWRFYLPKPNEFELCWATNNIPAEANFDLPEDSIHRSHLDLADGQPMGGKMSMIDSVTFDGTSPLEVLVNFRIDAGEDGGEVFLNFEIGEPGMGTSGFFQPLVNRGSAHTVEAEDTDWMLGAGISTARGGYSVAGFGIEHSATKIPLLDGPLSLDEPNLLLKVRASKEVGEMKYEPIAGPAPGLMIWVQRRKDIQTEDEPITESK